MSVSCHEQFSSYDDPFQKTDEVGVLEADKRQQDKSFKKLVGLEAVQGFLLARTGTEAGLVN